MSEPVDAWWLRRQWSKNVAVPYPVGQFRANWAQYPVLQRQFHPDLNGGLALSQIPPAADVLLLWVCELGHRFAATPWEQRNRPTGSRRRSTWCPECATAATKRQGRQSRHTGSARVCARSNARGVPEGTAFCSPCAPKSASAAEPALRALLEARLDVSLSAVERVNAVRTAGRFFDHMEVWPDIVLNEFRVAIEYDSTGRSGLEHIGVREKTDREKDRLLRAVGWEVIRVRTANLPLLGAYDLAAPRVSATLADRILDRLGEIRGALIVSSYLR